MKLTWWLVLGALIIGTVAVDQWSKRVVLERVPLGQRLQPIPALAAVFEITHTQNTGAAFGILPQASNLLLWVAPIVSLLLVALYPRIPERLWLRRIATGLICGGALGNALDRWQYGYVVDFIHYQIPGVISNVSNLADHGIVFGVLLMLVSTWREEAQQATPDAPAV